MSKGAFLHTEFIIK